MSCAIGLCSSYHAEARIARTDAPRQWGDKREGALDFCANLPQYDVQNVRDEPDLDGNVARELF
jgi:hypothetical protein